MMFDQQSPFTDGGAWSYPDWAFGNIAPIPGQPAGLVEGGVHIIKGSSASATSRVEGTVEQSFTIRKPGTVDG